MIGTFAGALDARKIDAKNGKLVADVRGEIETTDDNVLIIRRVHIAFTLQAADEHRETVERVHAVFADKCPLYRTLRSAIQISSDFKLVSGSAA